MSEFNFGTKHCHSAVVLLWCTGGASTSTSGASKVLVLEIAGAREAHALLAHGAWESAWRIKRVRTGGVAELITVTLLTTCFVS